MNRERHIIANNATAKEEILQAAMYSYCGRIIYQKWSEKEHRFILRSHVVVPIDCGVTSRGNEVLYAEDVDEGMQLKQFIIKQIRDFKNLKEKQHTAYPVQLDNIKRMFGIRKVDEDYDVAASAGKTRSLVAQEVYEFSGCEGHLYSDRKKKDPKSYAVVGDDGRTGRIARMVMERILGTAH